MTSSDPNPLLLSPRIASASFFHKHLSCLFSLFSVFCASIFCLSVFCLSVFSIFSIFCA